jgi:hypothetical protein
VGGARDLPGTAEAECQLISIDPQLKAVELRVEVRGADEPGLCALARFSEQLAASSVRVAQVLAGGQLIRGRVDLCQDGREASVLLAGKPRRRANVAAERVCF